jgi:hypothetical protein
MGCSEHQISLSKGLIAKFVQRKELAGTKKATAVVALFVPLLL